VIQLVGSSGNKFCAILFVVHVFALVCVAKMPKRKLEDELEEDWADTGIKAKTSDKKNSLDSDEEDDGEERGYDILAEDEIDGTVSNVF
jgi:hypothetical protein